MLLNELIRSIIQESDIFFIVLITHIFIMWEKLRLWLLVEYIV